LTYSTFAAVSERVQKRRPSTEVVCVPGIMAFQALASRTGTIVAEDRTRVVICTALGDEDLACELADPATTVVVYKGGRRLPELLDRAVAAGRAADATAGELIGMPGERIGSLRELAAGGPASYLATVIIPAARSERG
jgi:precorrin-2/cobalt-factor-2 C20-methyltransferase